MDTQYGSPFDAELACNRAAQLFVRLDTETGRGVMALRYELGHDPVHGIDGHGESNTGAGSRGAVDRRVHADEPSGAVEQWPTGVSRVDGCIRLDEMLDEIAVFCGEGAVERRDDPRRQCPVEAERIADGVDFLAHQQIVARADRNRYRGAGRNPNPQNGDVVRAADADQCGGIVFSVGKSDGGRRCVRDDVQVGDDMSRTVPNESRSSPMWDCLDTQG